MGQGVLQDVSGRLVETFAKNLAAMLEAGEAPPARDPGRARGRAGRRQGRGARRRARADALDLGSLGGAVVADRLKDPRTLAGIAVLVLLVLLLRRRR